MARTANVIARSSAHQDPYVQCVFRTIDFSHSCSTSCSLLVSIHVPRGVAVSIYYSRPQ